MYPAPPRAANRPAFADEAGEATASLPGAFSSAHALAEQKAARLREHGPLIEFTAGSKAALPLALGIMPFMVIYGVLACAAGLSPLETQAMTVLVFSGAQLVAAQMLAGGAPGAIIFAAGATMNLRHTLYSAILAPYLRRLPLRWRLLLAYLLTDETFTLTISRYQQFGPHRHRHWFLLGAGIIIWFAAQAATLLGVLLGEQVPASWNLDYTAPLTFIGLLVMSLKNRAGFSAALCAGLAALLFVSLPLKSGLLAATGFGIAAGVLFEYLARSPREGQP